MPEVTVEIGGRPFQVACQEGEEHFLQSAAKMLDDEAQALTSQTGRLPENRMLLMAGLLLADKTAAAHDKVAEVEAELAAARQEIEALKSVTPQEPQTIEVEVIPPHVADSLAALADRAESIAEKIDG